MVKILPVVLWLLALSAKAQTVQIVYAITSPQARYADSLLEKSLHQKGYVVKQSKPDYQVILDMDSVKLPAEAFSIVSNGKKISITGGDERGLIYGSLSLAEDVRNGMKLQDV